jgi:tRNA(Ile)-lysidine synthase
MIDPVSFSQAMQAFAPFEPRPLIAVAVSGGPDSMALLLLLDRWAQTEGGSVIGLTVEHGLRPESAAEAYRVGQWLAARGIEHETLPWDGDKPTSGVQAAARAARYDLLAAACAARGILHLAAAHHADDQAETVLLRRQAKSGGDGLAGMSATRSLGAVRLIRPLLGWPKAALIQTCADLGQAFAEDPSNDADYYARTHLRRILSSDLGQRQEMLEIAAQSAVLRTAKADGLTEILAGCTAIYPNGMVLIDPARLSALDGEMRRAAIAAVLRTAGGMRFAPAADAVDRLDATLSKEEFRGASLGGCAVRHWRGAILVCREPGRVQPPVPLAEGAWRRWDERFFLRVKNSQGGPDGLQAGALGSAGYANLRRLAGAQFPAIVGSGLPAVRSGDMLLSVPSVGWSREGAPVIEQRLAPPWPLSPERFTVVSAGPDIIFVKDTWERHNIADPDPRCRSRPVVRL